MWSAHGLHSLMSWGFLLDSVGIVGAAVFLQHVWGGGASTAINLGCIIAYGAAAAVYAYQARGPVVVAGTAYFTKEWVGRTLFGIHTTGLLLMLVWHSPWSLILAVEMVWFFLWVGGLVWVLSFRKAPFSLGCWAIGSVIACSSRDMVLDAMQSTCWWNRLTDVEKQELWHLLPEWKWGLYAHVSAQRV